jgi:predicted TIM-barrel fold metal-dependent hydrolase
VHRLQYEYGNDDVNFDPVTRIRDMDADGVAAEVVFHGAFARDPIPFFGPMVSTTFSQDVPDTADARRLRHAGITMYNRWLADWCSTAPGRLIGVAHIPMWDVVASVAAARSAADAGLRCINLPSPRRGLPGYNDPAWDPLWEVCCELGVSLHTHGGGGEGFPVTGPGSVGIHLAELGVAGRRGLWQMIFGGVFERFPAVRFFVTEQNGAWVVDLLQTLDSAYLCPMQSRETPFIQDVLPKLPSEYFASNCVVGASFMSRMEATAAVDHGYWRNVTWGRDYPHSEGTWPYTRESLSATFAGLA